MAETKRSKTGLILALLAAAGLLLAYLLLADHRPAAQSDVAPVEDPVFVVPYTEDVDVTHADRILDMGDLSAHVSLSRPAEPMKEIPFRITFTDETGKIQPDSASLIFNMKMDMGPHNYDLVFNGKEYTATAVLPTCMSGGKRWYGKLRVRRGDATLTSVFILDLQ